MKTCWLNRSGHPDCILFIAGWGMGPKPFQQLTAESVDVIMAYDYRSLDDTDLQSQLPENSRLHLLAWSMGVWAAGRLFQQNTFSSATAIGGTCRPVDDKYGIPGRVFDTTIADFSPVVLTDFYKAMFENPLQSQYFLENPPERSLDGLKEELIALRAACRTTPATKDIFERRIVTGRDRIFPARNQIRAWGRDNCDSIALPHFPFYQWSSWAELLECLSRRGASPRKTAIKPPKTDND